MENTNQEFIIEYRFIPSPDAEEKLQQAIDLILDLLIEEFQKELENNNGGEIC